ncbi:Yip1 family protein [Pseudogracilibacillus sp. SO30301A]|uniref:Yip1 family protein n=1 Tax=Pseudogracilibacillus sp. SO30301A TaxID=3098291 RepID=UPI00300E523D
MEKLEEDSLPLNVDEKGEKLNPWLTIWYAPRATMRSAINYRNSKLLIFLAIMAGITEFFDRAISDNLGVHMNFWVVLLMIIVVGGIIGIISWFIWSAINYYVGKLLKGKGTYDEMRVAMAISFIPFAISVIFCFLDVLFLREKLFTNAVLSPFQIGWLLLSAFFVFILAVWSFFLMIKAVAEAHQFSSWKGLLTLIIPAAVIFVLVLGIVLVAL